LGVGGRGKGGDGRKGKSEFEKKKIAVPQFQRSQIPGKPERRSREGGNRGRKFQSKTGPRALSISLNLLRADEIGKKSAEDIAKAEVLLGPNRRKIEKMLRSSGPLQAPI